MARFTDSRLCFGNVHSGQLFDHRRPSDSYRFVCTRCIYDDHVGGIEFDEHGLCNYCHQVDGLAERYGTGLAKGQTTFERMVEQIRRDGRKRPFDCVVGVSGGTDSSYLVRQATQEWGLRVLAVHYDNTWNTATAAQNIAEVVSTYGADLWTYVVNHRVADDIFRSFFMAGVPELEASTDLAFAYVLRTAAVRFGVNYVLEGHSFLAEGVTPLNSNYFDGRYITSVFRRSTGRSLWRQNAKVHRENRYPLFTLSRFLRHAVLHGVKFVRPLWYLNYNKGMAKDVLRRETSWSDYGGHHLENRLTSFFHSVYLPQKFGVDMRNNALSAQVRQGLRSRESAWQEYCREPYVEPGLVEFVCNRLEISPDEYSAVMAGPRRHWKEFRTYKRSFESLEPLFRYLAAKETVTMSFYEKYCK